MSRKSSFREVVYTCTKCLCTQKIRYFFDDVVLPIVCCVKCRAGFGIELREMLAQGNGMLPGKPVLIES